MFRYAVVLTLFAGAALKVFCADDLTCDFRDQTQKCVQVVKACEPGSIEISATHNAIIKIGYVYAGKAPAFIKIKDDCPKGQTLMITAEPGAQFKNEQPAIKEQVAEFVCGSLAPNKIHFNLGEGSRTFTYYNSPKDCSPVDYLQEKEKTTEKGAVNGR